MKVNLYGMEIYKKSEEFKQAVSDLRKALGVSRRAQARLNNGYIPKRRRTTKAKESVVEASPENPEIGGHSDRED